MMGLVLAGCSTKELIEKIADKEKVKTARSFVDRLLAEDFSGLARDLDPEFKNGKELEQIKAMHALIPRGRPKSEELVGYWVQSTNGVTRYSVTFQFAFEDKWLVARTIWTEPTPGAPVLYGMTVNPLDRPLQEIYAFTFERAGALHFFFLLGAIGIPVFILVTLVVCIRTKFPRRKWLWIIFILIGVVQASFDWTTGAADYRLFHFQLFGAGAISGGEYSPLILYISIPVGAIAFWFKRRELLRVALTPPPLNTAVGN